MMCLVCTLSILVNIVEENTFLCCLNFEKNSIGQRVYEEVEISLKIGLPKYFHRLVEILYKESVHSSTIRL